MIMNNKLEHVPATLKHFADASAGTSVLLAWITTLTPFLNFGIVILVAIWGYYRVKDIKLSIELKKLKIRRHEDLK